MAKVKKTVVEGIDDIDLEIPFDEFDKVMVAVATNDSDDEEIETEIDLDDDDVEVSGDEISYENFEDEDQMEIEEDNLGDPPVEGPNGPNDPANAPAKSPEDQKLESRKVAGRSIMDLYEARKRRQNNPLVESLLTDNVVDQICTSLNSVLDGHGISRAQQYATLGMILDRMLKAGDQDITDPIFMDSVLGELVDTEDLKGVIKKAVEDAIEGKQPNLKPIEDIVNEPEELSTEAEIEKPKEN